jgi:hypothetical protein
MLKKFNGPGGDYVKEVDLGPNPFEDKMYKDPFNTTRWNLEAWDKPEMRKDYREVNVAYESLSPKEFAGAGELYADKKYEEENPAAREEDPYRPSKKGYEMGNFGMESKDDDDSDDKGAKRRKKLESMG